MSIEKGLMSWFTNISKGSTNWNEKQDGVGVGDFVFMFQTHVLEQFLERNRKLWNGKGLLALVQC